MKPANDKGPSEKILDEGLDVEDLSASLGLTEDAIRNVCYKHSSRILERMRAVAEDSILEFAHNEGLVELQPPEEIDASSIFDGEIKIATNRTSHARSLTMQLTDRKLRNVIRNNSNEHVQYKEEDSTKNEKK